MSRYNAFNQRSCFAQILLFIALCIHRQVCQCYAGGDVNGVGNRSPSLLARKNLLNHPGSTLTTNNHNIRQLGSYFGSGRKFNSRLRQASIATSIDDGEESNNDGKGISVRGGSIPVNEDKSSSGEDIVDTSTSSAIPNPTSLNDINAMNSNHDNVAEINTPPPIHPPVQNEQEEEEKNNLITNDDNSNNEIEQVQVAQVQNSEGSQQPKREKKWPCGDELDRKLIKIALPCIANFAINPLVGAVDLFWINRMGNTLAVAGQAAANQIFSSAFWLTSFLPAVTATLVAKQYARKNQEGVQDALCQALVVGTFIAIIGSAFILTQPDRLLSGVLAAGAPAREFARPYLFIRGFAFLPSMFSLIGFSAFRGVMDTVTPLKISLFANLLNAILDPILIFTFKMGVTGAALATLVSEIASGVIFTTLLLRRQLIVPSKMFRIPEWAKLAPLLKGGAALQLRNFALNVTFLAVTRVTQSIDDTGVAAAAHAMAIQTFQIGGIVLLALSTVAQIVVPNAMIEKVDEETGEKTGGFFAAKDTVSRLMRWGLILGIILGSLQTLLIPSLQKSTPIIAVREAARVPALLASLYQVINGIVFIGEGVMVGCGSFLQLSLSTLVATIATLLALYKFPTAYGLTGVWMSFGVFNTLRLIGVMIHQKITGPLSSRNASKKIKEA